MFVLGLTGSIGTGKSTVSAYLEKQGIPVLDADKIVAEVYRDKAFCRKVAERFTEDILAPNGYINRKVLSEKVFGDKELLQELNAFVHPKIKDIFQEKTQALEGKALLVVYDIPLLYEAKMDNLTDKVALVTAEEDIQKQRIASRDNRSMTQIEQILAMQFSQEEKKKRADYILDNNGSLEELYRQVDEMILELRQMLQRDEKSGKERTC